MQITIDTLPNGTIDVVKAETFGETSGRELLERLCPKVKPSNAAMDLQTLEKLMGHVAAGAKIQAIKVVRETFTDQHGLKMGLKEAKEWVEAHAMPLVRETFTDQHGG